MVVLIIFPVILQTVIKIEKANCGPMLGIWLCHLRTKCLESGVQWHKQ